RLGGAGRRPDAGRRSGPGAPHGARALAQAPRPWIHHVARRTAARVSGVDARPRHRRGAARGVRARVRRTAASTCMSPADRSDALVASERLHERVRTFAREALEGGIATEASAARAASAPPGFDALALDIARFQAEHQPAFARL